METGTFRKPAPHWYKVMFQDKMFPKMYYSVLIVHLIDGQQSGYPLLTCIASQRSTRI